MKKVEVKVVIGSNYGDECKGLATHYFSAEAAKNEKSCLNVLFNGGCQRGHTVETKDTQLRHIFHHFGSGTFDGAYTYFDQNFIVNPIFFCIEKSNLNDMGYSPISYISPECKVSTPYDAFLNQIIEANRGAKKHGSCGLGIWETQKRYKNSHFNFSYIEMAKMREKDLYFYLWSIAHIYFPAKLLEYGIEEIPPEYMTLIDSKELINKYIADFQMMKNSVIVSTFEEIAQLYDVIVFEGAQGLSLDENNMAEYPNVTASSTKSKIPIERSNSLDGNVEICYITRSYFTRHGVGRLPDECDKSKINPNIEDLTNVHNDYQDYIRYAPFNCVDFCERVMMDSILAKCISTNPVKTSIFVSHLNYTDGEIFGDCAIDDLAKKFDITYRSSSKYAEDVIK